jgi:hypothetical protein
MGKIIDYRSNLNQSLSTTPRSTLRERATPGSFGSAEGKAQAQMGRTLQGLGEVGMDFTDHFYQHKKNEGLLKNKSTISSLRLKHTKKLDEIMLNGDPDEDHLTNFLREYNEEVSDIKNNISIPEVADDFAVKSDQIMESLSVGGMRMQAQRRAEKVKAHHLMSMQSDSALLLDDPNQFETVFLENKADLFRKDGPYSALTNAQKDILMVEMGNKFSIAAIKGYEKTSPYNAIAAIDGGLFDAFADSEKLLTIKNQILGRIKQAETKANKLETLKHSDFWSWVDESKKFPNRPIIDLSDPTSISRYTDWRDMVSKTEGVHKRNMPFFEPSVLDGLNDVMMSGETKQLNSVFKSIDMNLNSSDKLAAANQISTKNPSFAVGIMISEEAPNVSLDIINGRRLTKKAEDKYLNTGQSPYIMPDNTQIISEFQSYVGNALHGSYHKSQLFREAVFDHYIYNQFKSNKSLKDFNEKEFRNSFDAVLGKPISQEGQVILPFRKPADPKKQQYIREFIDEVEFTSIVNTFTDNLLEDVLGSTPMTRSGQAINIGKAGDRAFLRNSTAGEGKYELFFRPNSGQQATQVVNKDGSPYIVDMIKLYNYFYEKTGGEIKKSLILEEDNTILIGP